MVTRHLEKASARGEREGKSRTLSSALNSNFNQNISEGTREDTIWIEISQTSLSQTPSALNLKQMRWRTGSLRFNFCWADLFMAAHWYVQKTPSTLSNDGIKICIFYPNLCEPLCSSVLVKRADMNWII